MEEEVFLDTVRLQEHVLQLKKERSYAQVLYDELYTLENLSASELQIDSYQRLRKEAEGLVRYFSAMVNAIEELGDNAEQLAVKIGQMLQDNLDSNPIRTIFRE